MMKNNLKFPILKNRKLEGDLKTLKIFTTRHSKYFMKI